MAKLIGWENSGVTVIVPEDIYNKIIALYGPSNLTLTDMATIMLQVSRVRKAKIALLYCKRNDLTWETSGPWESKPNYTPKELFVPGAAWGETYDLSMYATDPQEVARILGS